MRKQENELYILANLWYTRSHRFIARECACIQKSERVALKRRTKDSGEKCGGKKEKNLYVRAHTTRTRANPPPGRKL